MTNSGTTKQHGFTLVEVLIVVPMVALSIAVLGAALVSLFTGLAGKNAQLELELNSQAALFNMRDDLFYATRFAGEPQPDTTDSYSPSGGWNAIRDKALVVYEAAYTKNRQSSDRQLVYKQNLPHSCLAEQVIENQYSTNTLIYFRQGSTLYRRVLVPDQSQNCSTTFRTQTCPATNTTFSCPEDTIIAENVKSFEISYFKQSANQDTLDPDELEANPKAFIQASRADISLTLEKLINGDPVTASAKINIKKIE